MKTIGELKEMFGELCDQLDIIPLSDEEVAQKMEEYQKGYHEFLESNG